MAQVEREQRIHLLLRRITRAQRIIATSVDQIRSLAPALAGSSAGGGIENFYGSMSGAHAAGGRSPIVDLNAMTITWDGRTCRVRQLLLLRLFDRLSRRPDHFVPIDRLLRDVWDGHVRTDNTVRSTVRHLKHRLLAAEMGELASAIRASGRRYGLFLNHCD